MSGNKDMGADSRLSQAEPGSLGPSGFDPAREMLRVDCTGDETLWVFRYASYFKSVSGCELSEAIVHANAAWDAWGNDPDTTPEEVASSDYAIATEAGTAETHSGSVHEGAAIAQDGDA